jgi:hypothetical protein
LALADDNHNKTRECALDSLYSIVSAAKKSNNIDGDIINNITRGIVLNTNNLKNLKIKDKNNENI